MTEEKEVCSRVFPDGVVRSGFLNEEGTYCIIKAWHQEFKFPVVTTKRGKE